MRPPDGVPQEDSFQEHDRNDPTEIPYEANDPWYLYFTECDERAREAIVIYALDGIEGDRVPSGGAPVMLLGDGYAYWESDDVYSRILSCPINSTTNEPTWNPIVEAVFAEAYEDGMVYQTELVQGLETTFDCFLHYWPPLKTRAQVDELKARCLAGEIEFPYALDGYEPYVEELREFEAFLEKHLEDQQRRSDYEFELKRLESKLAVARVAQKKATHADNSTSAMVCAHSQRKTFTMPDGSEVHVCTLCDEPVQAQGRWWLSYLDKALGVRIADEDYPRHHIVVIRAPRNKRRSGILKGQKIAFYEDWAYWRSVHSHHLMRCRLDQVSGEATFLEPEVHIEPEHIGSNLRFVNDPHALSGIEVRLRNETLGAIPLYG